MDSRRSTIKSAYSTTCGWLLKHPAYVDWIDSNKFHEHRGFLWINGKPGAGKSTLVKFAHANADKERPEHEILVSFFFNARGDELERSTIGMYRALLFQLLKKAADLQKVLDDFHLSSGYQSQRPAWTIELLHKLLSAAIARLGQRRLECFIDALDECDEQQVREMIVFFEEFGQNALENGSQLYICFASRHYPTIDIRSGRQLTLENEHGHGEDLAKYVQSHLRAEKGKYIEEVRTQIQEKANGVFMWAVLAIDILNKEFRYGRIFAVRKRLQEIPAKLSDLFEDILRRDSANMPDLLLCLQWILFARRPLRREEFYFAMVAGLDPEPENMTEWNSEHTTVDDMSRFVLNSSKGLAELTKSKTPTVQYIHESVRDFLIKDNGLCELWPGLQEDLYSFSHDQLKRCCSNYLMVDLSGHITSDNTLSKASSDSAKDLRQRLTIRFPFLEYASLHVLFHADEAARGIPQDNFLVDFALDTWVNVSNLFERYDIRRHTPDASLLYVLAEKNFARLIRITCLQGSTMNTRGQRYHYPLFAALANGHRDAVQALLQQDGNSSLKDFTTHLEFGRAFSVRKDYTPLLWALEKGHKALAEIFVTSTDVDLSLKDHGGRSVLSLAADRGYERIVNILLVAHEVDADLDDNNHRTPLSYAAQQGRTAVVQLLIEHGAKIEAIDNNGKTALLWAAQSEKETVQLLLDHGANIEAKDNDGKTALLWAVESKKETIVQQLLNKNAKIEATDNSGKTALLWAAQSEKETVQLLLDYGANIEAKDNNCKRALLWGVKNRNGRTPLSYAAEYGDKHTVRLLLAQNANVAVKDKTGKIPLLWVIDHSQQYYSFNPYKSPLSISKNVTGLQDYQLQLMLLEQSNKERSMIARLNGTMADRVEIVQLMLAKDSKLNAKGNDGKTALISAVERGWDAIVQLLLDKDVDIEAVDNHGKTALLWAAGSGRETIMQLLLDKDANIEATDNNGNTALGWALGWRNDTIVKLLVAKGANIEVQDKDGQTPFLYAIKNEDDHAVRLLLAHDATAAAGEGFN